MGKKINPLYKLGDRVEFINPYSVNRSERITIYRIKKRGKNGFFYSKDGNFYIAENQLKLVKNKKKN